jgi:hypothetical protein
MRPGRSGRRASIAGLATTLRERVSGKAERSSLSASAPDCGAARLTVSTDGLSG